MQIVSRDNLHECQILFSRKNKKNISSLSSSEFGHSIVSVHCLLIFAAEACPNCTIPIGILWNIHSQLLALSWT